jgi:hypothetical protein
MRAKRMFECLAPMLAIAIGIMFINPAAEAAVNVGSGWVWQNPLPQADNLSAISCPGTSICYAVGDLGTILFTQDGGTTWKGQSSTTNRNLHGISCPGLSTCFAVGDAGVILATNTSGSAWSALNKSGITTNLKGISCPSTSVCYAVDGSSAIFYTLSGNANIPWGRVPGGGVAVSCPTTTDCYTVSGTTVNRGRWVGGLGTLWSLPGTATTPPLDGNLSAISCVSASACVAVADGVPPSKGANTIATIDSGSSWTQNILTTSTTPFIELHSVSCIVGDFGPICNAVGHVGGKPANEVFVSNNGGSSWSAVSANDTVSLDYLNGISCAPALSGKPPLVLITAICYAVGDIGGIVTNSSSVGGAWASQETTIGPTFIGLGSEHLDAASCPQPGTCYAVGEGGFYASSNGGAWSLRNSQVSGFDISCPGALDCFVAAGNAIFTTHDGGTSWKSGSVLVGGTPIGGFAISCPSTQVCVVVGVYTLYTNDAGNLAPTWAVKEVTFGTGFSVSCPSTSMCVEVGASGHISFTTNPGLSVAWVPSNSNTTNNLSAVSCPTTTDCFVVGDSGGASNQPATFLKGRFDGRNWSWTPQTPSVLPLGDAFNSISCLPPSTFSGIACWADTSLGEIVGYTTIGGSPSFTLEAAISPQIQLTGISCGGSTGILADFECAAVGYAETILTKTVVSKTLGTGELTPRNGSSEVGEPATFQLTWTVPVGKSWRDLESLDLKLADDSAVGLWARFYVGNPSTFALLDANGRVVAAGVPGTAGTLQSSTATLDLARSSFKGSGPAGPSVTINFVVSFKPAAAGERFVREYDTEISATDLTGTEQSPERVGHWVIQSNDDDRRGDDGQHGNNQETDRR